MHHTSREHKGQIYIPFVNWALYALCIVVISTFRTTDNLGSAYGALPYLDVRCCY